jgi:hypothetical protein
MEWTSNVNFRINGDAQLVATTTHPPGMGYTAPVVLSREESLELACDTIMERIVDGTIDRRLTLRTFLFQRGCFGSTWDYGDRLLTEKYVDNDTGET